MPGLAGQNRVMRGIRTAASLDGRQQIGHLKFRVLRRSRVLKHKFVVGETVYFTASNVARPAASGTYEVIRLLPTDGDDFQYRIKSSTEAFERVAKESQLAGS